jgi:hypothetical protein
MTDAQSRRWNADSERVRRVGETRPRPRLLDAEAVEAAA